MWGFSGLWHSLGQLPSCMAHSACFPGSEDCSRSSSSNAHWQHIASCENCDFRRLACGFDLLAACDESLQQRGTANCQCQWTSFGRLSDSDAPISHRWKLCSFYLDPIHLWGAHEHCNCSDRMLADAHAWEAPQPSSGMQADRLQHRFHHGGFRMWWSNVWTGLALGGTVLVRFAILARSLRLLSRLVGDPPQPASGCPGKSTVFQPGLGKPWQCEDDSSDETTWSCLGHMLSSLWLCFLRIELFSQSVVPQRLPQLNAFELCWHPGISSSHKCGFLWKETSSRQGVCCLCVCVWNRMGIESCWRIESFVLRFYLWAPGGCFLVAAICLLLCSTGVPGSTFVMSFAVLGRLSLDVSFTTILVAMADTFPESAQKQVLPTFAVATRVGSLMAPFLGTLPAAASCSLFSFLCFAASGATMVLPEPGKSEGSWTNSFDSRF